MTDKLALYLGLIIFAALVADMVFYDFGNLIFLARKLFALANWIAFWR